MARILVALFVVMLCGGAQAAAPEFNTEHFCSDFADKRGGDSMGGIARAVCILSEQSTKTVVAKAWDHVSADGRETCVKGAGESYVKLAQCLGSVTGQ